MKRIERSRRFRRTRLSINERRGVSPVVATLILILIAVAAAAALYLWLVAWQGGVTAGIGSPGAQYTLTIGGSTSVYPFASQAASWFEANNSDVVVSVNQGGSGAGMAAVCSGQVNIGEASAFYSASSLEASYGCPSTLNEQIVAYDGVDAITQTANTHGLESMDWTTLQTIIAQASTTAPTSGFIFQQGGSSGPTFDGQVLSGIAGFAVPVQGTEFTWAQLPACAPAQNPCGAVAHTIQVESAGAGAGGAACAAPWTADICAVTPGTTATPCGFSVCAGGAGSVHIYYRSDVSGTTQSFLSRLVAAAGTATGTAVSLQFTGCGGDNQFDGCGGSYASAVSTGEAGNPAVIQGVAGDANGLGYASDGLVQASGSGVLPVNFQGYGQSVVVTIQGESTALKAIAKGIADVRNGGATYGTDQAYIGWRPFMNVETTPPTGEALRYLQFVMDPANNENIASATAEISVYASGLAGVVPITPITGYQETL